MSATTTSALLAVDDLTVELGPAGARVTPVTKVSFSIGANEVLGLVGESGCGKTLTSLAIMRLLPQGAAIRGRIALDDEELAQLDDGSLRALRGSRMAMVFQEPMTSLDPVWTIGEQIVETRRAHAKVSRAQARAEAVELLRRVGLSAPERRLRAYPHELSGGMRQRVMIAIALANGPRLLIADEPTTALDVTVQAQVLELLDELRRESRMAVLLITHDLAVVSDVADRVAVMYAGEIVETAPTDALFDRPRHPYTRGLMASVPGQAGGGRLPVIPGRVPTPAEMPAACRFADRCPNRIARCTIEHPPLEPDADGHLLRCFNPDA